MGRDTSVAERNKPAPYLLLLGVQHLFVMFGATVLVPLLTGMDVGVTLFASGVGTLLFHVVTRFEVPVYLGSSFAFLPAIIAVSQAEGGSLAQACGGMIIAGALYCVASACARLFSVDAIYRLFPPHVIGPIILLIALMLAPVAVRNASGADDPALRERIGEAGCIALAAATFMIGALVRIYAGPLRMPVLALVPVLVAILAGFSISLVLGLVDFGPVLAASWFGLPAFQAPEFSFPAMALIAPVALVTILEHLGDVLAIGKVVEKDFVARPGLHRTLLGDGLATAVAGLVGGPANTTYSENTGAVALTGVRDPRVMRIAATLAILLAFLPKVSALLGALPTPVIGGISILLFGMIAGVGIRTLTDPKVELHRPEVLIVTTTMLVLGVGDAQLVLGSFQLGGVGLAAFSGITLHLLFGCLRRPST